MRSSGRPFGGIAWLYYSELYSHVKIVHITNNISTCILKTNQIEVKIVGVYMPTNNIEQYREDIKLIETIIEGSKDQAIIILGDFNSCVYRSHQYTSVQRNMNCKLNNIVNKSKLARYPCDKELKTFVNKQKLIILSNLYVQNTYNTFLLNSKYSNIDHIIVQENTQINITSVSVITKCCCKYSCWDHDNLSDHRAVKLEFNVTMNNIDDATNDVQPGNLISKRVNKLKVDWKKEFSVLRYQNQLDKTMIDTNIYATAFKTSCFPNGDNLRSLLDHLHSAILLAKERSSDGENNNRYENKRGMNPEIGEQIKNKSIWHKDNTTEGRIIRNHFRSNQRKAQRQSANVRINKISETLNEYFKENNRQKFWAHIKTTNRTKDTVEIDVNDLEKYYDKILNESEITSNLNMERISQLISDKMKSITYKGNIEISYETIDHILWGLKSNKARGISNIENECFKYSNHNTMIPIIKLIIETMINNNIKISEINTGLLTPIIKDTKASNKDINNIRPITLSDTIAIILEQIILLILKKYTSLHELQFGFTENNSTQHAIFVLRETILDSLLNKEKLYLCFMDFSKAFDKLNKNLLLAKLNNKINDLMWMMINNYINSARIVVKCNNKMSKHIDISRGVKQGGPASPHMFAYYVDEMIRQVVRIGLVCSLMYIMVGIICYADDTTIMTKTIAALQRTVDHITEYCRNHEIKINESKTKWMVIGTKKQREETKDELIINGVIVERVTTFKFLGYWVNDILKEEEHINIRLEKSRNVTYALTKLGFWNYKMKYNIKSFLYCAYSRATLKYGFENVFFTQTQLKKIKTQECLLLKRALMLPKNTSNTKLTQALNIPDIEKSIKIRKLKFIKQLLDNGLTRRIIEKQVSDAGKIHKHSLIKDVLDNYITNDHENVDNLAKLNEVITREIEHTTNKLDANNTDDIENIRYLLRNRNKLNNLTLVNLLQKGYG
jgi:hypothetical protein